MKYSIALNKTEINNDECTVDNTNKLLAIMT